MLAVLALLAQQGLRGFFDNHATWPMLQWVGGSLNEDCDCVSPLHLPLRVKMLILSKGSSLVFMDFS